MNQEDIDHIFKYHPPKNEKQVGQYQSLRDAGRKLACSILAHTPAGPEQTLAIRKVQEAIMWANASIALAKGPDGG